MIKIINYIKEGLLMIGTAMTSAIFLFSVCAFIALFIGPVATGFIFFVSLVVFAFYYDGEQYSKNPKVSSIHIMEFANETPKYTFFILMHNSGNNKLSSYSDSLSYTFDPFHI